MNEQRSEFGDAAAKIAELTDLIADQIRRLSKLHEEGILTDEEFSSKKQELLARL